MSNYRVFVKNNYLQIVDIETNELFQAPAGSVKVTRKKADSTDFFFEGITVPEAIIIAGIEFEDTFDEAGNPYANVEALADFYTLNTGKSSGEVTPVESVLKLQNNITFDNVIGNYFGTIASPRTGALTFDTSSAVRGGIAIVYYLNDTLNMPTPWLTSGTFSPNQINKIYLERDGEGFVTCNILNFFSNLPLAPTSFSLTESIF